MQTNWSLKATDDLNQMLKVRDDLESIQTKEYNKLLTMSHRFATSDDVLFPEPATLAYFSNLEDICLNTLEDAIYVAQDIHTGMLDIHIYTKDYDKTIHTLISHLKYKPEFHVDFKVTQDENWNIIKNIGN